MKLFFICVFGVLIVGGITGVCLRLDMINKNLQTLITIEQGKK